MAITLIIDRQNKKYCFYFHANDEHTKIRFAQANRILHYDYETDEQYNNNLSEEEKNKIKKILLKENNINNMYIEDSEIETTFDSLKPDY